MKKRKSIFFNLLAPICTVTMLLLLLASLILSTIYMQQALNTAVTSNKEILNQARASLEILHGYFAKLTTDISQKPYMSAVLELPTESAVDEWNNRHKLGLLFSNNPNTMIDYEMMIAGTGGLSVGSGNGGVTLSSQEIMEHPAFAESVKTGKVIYKTLPSGISYGSKNHQVIIGYKALCHADKTPYGCLLLSFREEDLRKFYQNFISKDNNISLLSAEGIILSSQLAEEVGTKDLKLLSVVTHNEENGLEYSKDPHLGIILSRYVSYMDAYIVSEISPRFLMQKFLPNLQALLTIAGALLLLILMIACIIRSNLKPLQILALHMSSLKGVPTPIQLGRSAEMQMISSSYNEMVSTINHYLEELDAAHSKRRQDELNLLQMQINPHFLYNTLDSVKHLISMSDTTSACSTIEALIALLRSTLGNTDTIVSVEDEVTNIKNYVSIIEPRYGCLIRTELHVDDNCYKYTMPNLILQPIVENAFFHAFQNTKQGAIHIFITTDNSSLSCEVIDNGDGMNEEQLKKLLSGVHAGKSVSRIGVANVRERICLLYSEKSSFHISSERGYGTSIHFTIPAIPKGVGTVRI